MSVDLTWAAAVGISAIVGLIGKVIHVFVSSDLQAYKLHVAETYVNREVLREQLAPINRQLDRIEKDIAHRGSGNR